MKMRDKKQLLNNISSEHAREILIKLAQEDAKIASKIDGLALEYIKDVDPYAISEHVFGDLNSLEVEEVWDNSGSTRDGYIEPCELASEMFSEALEPYIDDLRRYQKISMNEEARLICMGIMKGIYMFKKEATTEFKNWAEDDPYDNFTRVFEEWKDANKDIKEQKMMNDYVKNNFPEWYK